MVRRFQNDRNRLSVAAFSFMGVFILSMGSRNRHGSKDCRLVSGDTIMSLAQITARRALIDADYPPRRSRWRVVAAWVAIGLVFWLWEVM